MKLEKTNFIGTFVAIMGEHSIDINSLTALVTVMMFGKKQLS